jgi:hypothetical protein
VIPDTDNGNDRFIERYLVFVGCADPECEHEDAHDVGWDTCAFGDNDLDNVREELIKIPENLWWHVLDLGVNPPRVIMRSSYGDERRH